MVDGSKHEAHACFLQKLGVFLAGQSQVDTERFEAVRRAAAGGNAPVAMLGDGDATGCDDEAGCGGNVEGVCSVSPGPYDFKDFSFMGDRHACVSHGSGKSCNFLDGLAFQ